MQRCRKLMVRIRGIEQILSSRAMSRITSALEKKSFAHYDHKDSCKLSRWTARESFQYMYARPWQKVSDFYLDLVRGDNGYSSLRSLFSSEKNNSQERIEICYGDEQKNVSNELFEEKKRSERTTYKIVLSYHGASFDGWQKQPGLKTVQGLVEESLGIFVDEKKAKKLQENSLPLEGCAVVAGRTDKGVTAIQQICSFYTWRKGVKCHDIKDAINAAAPGKLRVLSVSKVSRAFHPNFSAKWRRYFYMFPLEDGLQIQAHCNQFGSSDTIDEDNKLLWQKAKYIDNEDCSTFYKKNDCLGSVDLRMKPTTFCIDKVNKILCQLEGKFLSYRVFARDTKASRSSGPPTDCFIFHARAVETKLPCSYQFTTGEELRVMCVELVANRFLRKMVRVLVSTAIREAAAGAGDDALINLMDATCRRATAPPAPPYGLCLVDVGYTEFDRQNLFIL